MGDMSFIDTTLQCFFQCCFYIRAAIAITICFSQNHCAINLKGVVYWCSCDAFSVLFLLGQFLFYQKKKQTVVVYIFEMLFL